MSKQGPPLNYDGIINRLLKKRGYETKKQQTRFLNPTYETDVSDPFLLNDMDSAVRRLITAREQGEHVMIYGDYDIDGLTAVSLLLDAFAKFEIKVDAYIPDRFEEGYGLNIEALTKINDMGVDLVVTVDCGSVSVDVIAQANENLNLDIIVTDHHTVGDALPECVAVINPKRQDNTYPFNDLAGVGVAFKLVQALQQKLPGLEHGQEKWLLDLVALGTVCDVVGLIDENRVFVKWGLEVWRQTRRPGLNALLEVSGASDLSLIDTFTMGFQVGPRLNASGRMKHAQISLDTLTELEIAAARQSAQLLDKLNSDRRAEQQRIYDEAQVMADQDDNPVLVLANTNWSHGIVGIVAAKLLERYKKPAFVLEILPDKDIAKGSARSFGDFKAVDAVRAFDRRISGGGHAAAAGITIARTDIDEFRQVVNDLYLSMNFANQPRHLAVNSDIELDSFDLVNTGLTTALKQLAPFGRHNEEPVFLLKNVQLISQRLVGAKKNHLQIMLIDEHGQRLRGIQFNSGEIAAKRVDVLMSIKESSYRPGTVEFIAKNITPTLA